MRRSLALFLVLPLVSVAPVRADDDHRPLQPIPAEAPWMTGAQLLQKLSKPAEAMAAEDYIRGVYDATEHKDWCHAGPNGKALAKPRPVDLQAKVRAALGALAPAQLKRNAAELVTEAWQDQWPCPPDGCCHG
ncbi:Rap1a/Tai family immunity protein [Massilia sp. LXY-6]|uniref:Rap1a/Tai family immunity protein n=1 Tax=Massilia sp. LXY-6 TaxID=3379823 RepID=UPI003EE40FC6